MAKKATPATTTYSPSPTTLKTRPPIFRTDDVDWVRPDGRAFHQCRPACTFVFPFLRCLLVHDLGTDVVTPGVMKRSFDFLVYKKKGSLNIDVLVKGLSLDGSVQVVVDHGVLDFGNEDFEYTLLVFRTGAVNAASGSAYAEFGNTKVIVSVFGPRESKKAMMYSDIGRLNCSVSYTTFSTPVRGQGSENKEFSSMLHKALEGSIILETFPKTTVDVFALVLESGGSDLPVVISCASLALADAGIMLYDLVASVSVSCFGKNLLIDPMLEEENYHDGSLMITCMASRYEVTQLTITGEWSTAKINEGMQLCLDASCKLVEIMRTCLKESATISED